MKMSKYTDEEREIVRQCIGVFPSGKDIAAVIIAAVRRIGEYHPNAGKAVVKLLSTLNDYSDAVPDAQLHEVDERLTVVVLATLLSALLSIPVEPDGDDPLARINLSMN